MIFWWEYQISQNRARLEECFTNLLIRDWPANIINKFLLFHCREEFISKPTDRKTETHKTLLIARDVCLCLSVAFLDRRSKGIPLWWRFIWAGPLDWHRTQLIYTISFIRWKVDCLIDNLFTDLLLAGRRAGSHWEEHSHWANWSGATGQLTRRLHIFRALLSDGSADTAVLPFLIRAVRLWCIWLPKNSGTLQSKYAAGSAEYLFSQSIAPIALVWHPSAPYILYSRRSSADSTFRSVPIRFDWIRPCAFRSRAGLSTNYCNTRIEQVLPLGSRPSCIVSYTLR